VHIGLFDTSCGIPIGLFDTSCGIPTGLFDTSCGIPIGLFDTSCGIPALFALRHSAPRPLFSVRILQIGFLECI